MNVIEQVKNVCRSTIVKGAWKKGQDLTVHGLIYNIGNGLLQDLDISVNCFENLKSTIRKGIFRTLNGEA